MTDRTKPQVDHGLPVWLMIGFSGHRKINDEQKLRDGLSQVFEHALLQNRRLACLSSAACGADTVFLEEAAARQFPQFIILPFDRNSFRTDFDESQWARVEPLIDSAVDCEVLPEHMLRDEAFLDAGILTVDRSDLLIVFWDGLAASGTGGTGDVVAYARLIQKPLMIIDVAIGKLSCERLDLLQSVKSQDSTPHAPIAMPLKLVESEYKRQAAIAIQHGPKSRNLVLRLILLHLAASAVAIIALQFIDSTEIGFVGYLSAFVKLYALCFALYLVRQHHHAHTHWIQSRLATELCRCYLAIWKLRRNAVLVPDTDGLGLDSLSRSLRVLWYLDRGQVSSLAEARDQYLRSRLDDQLSYYQMSLAKTEPRDTWGRRLALAGTFGAIGAILITLLIPHHHHEEWLYQIAKSMSLLLPLLSAAVLSYLVAMDTGRRAVRYQEMIEVLGAAKTKLQSVHTWSGLWRLVSETERKLFREVAEWHAVARFGSESH